MSPHDSLVPSPEPNVPAGAAGFVESPSGATTPQQHSVHDTDAPEVGPTSLSADGDAGPADADLPGLAAFGRGRAGRKRPGKRLVKPEQTAPPISAEQRLLLLDTWQRSGLPAGDFAALVGMSKHTLYAWKKKFDTEGPAGLMDQQRGSRPGSRLPDLTKRTILMLKQANPEWGCQRISDMLVRGPALPASASAVAQVLHEAGYQMEEVTTRPHPDKVRRSEERRVGKECRL